MTETFQPKILIQPLKPALVKDVAQTLPVLIRIQAPDEMERSGAPRKPQHISLVIDRSGSMSGEPLHEALKCAEYVINRMSPEDSAAVVVFDDRVRTLVKLQKLGDRSIFQRKLQTVSSGGSTNLHGGWKAGVEQLEEGVSETSISRVLLLSDGNANAGDYCTAPEISAFCADAAAKGISTSTYGLGRSFNEDLMVEMGNRGGGSHYYGDTAEDLFEPFVAELDLLANLYARKVRLSIGAAAGVEVRQLNEYALEERDGFPRYCLPDIPLKAEVWILLELKIPAEQAMKEKVDLIQIGVTGSGVEENPILFPEAALALPTYPPAAWDVLVPDEMVAARHAELKAANALKEARAAAENSDWGRINAIIEDLQKSYAGFPWLTDVLAELEKLASLKDNARFLKESLYISKTLGSRRIAKDENLFNLSDEAIRPSFLRRKAASGKASFIKRNRDE